MKSKNIRFASGNRTITVEEMTSVRKNVTYKYPNTLYSQLRCEKHPIPEKLWDIEKLLINTILAWTFDPDKASPRIRKSREKLFEYESTRHGAVYHTEFDIVNDPNSPFDCGWGFTIRKHIVWNDSLDGSCRDENSISVQIDPEEITKGYTQYPTIQIDDQDRFDLVVDQILDKMNKALEQHQLKTENNLSQGTTK